MGLDASAPPSRPLPAAPAAPSKEPWWHALVILALLGSIVALVFAAVGALSPGPPQVSLRTFELPPTGCSGSTDHIVFPMDVELSNDGGPANVTMRAYVDGMPALIDGVNETFSLFVPGPEGFASAQFFVNGPDCVDHAVYVNIVSAVPA